MLPFRAYGQSNGFAVNWLPERTGRRIEPLDPDELLLRTPEAEAVVIAADHGNTTGGW